MTYNSIWYSANVTTVIQSILNTLYHTDILTWLKLVIILSHLNYDFTELNKCKVTDSFFNNCLL